MGRKILAVFVALIAAFAIMMVIQMLNSIIVQPPSAEVMGDPAKLKEFMAHAKLHDDKFLISGEFPKQLVKMMKEMSPLVAFLRKALA